MPKRLVIAVDCDDVLVPTASAIIDWYNRTYGTNVQLSDFYVKDSAAWGVRMHEAIRRVGGFIESDAHNAIAPYPKAVKAIATLAERHELHLVTGRSKAVESITRAFIEQYFPRQFKTIEHTGFFDEEDGTTMKRTKGDVCMDIKADVLIDDHIVHGREVLRHGVREVLLFGDYPWNQLDDDILGVTRCHNWDDVLRQVETISYETER